MDNWFELLTMTFVCGIGLSLGTGVVLLAGIAVESLSRWLWPNR